MYKGFSTPKIYLPKRLKLIPHVTEKDHQKIYLLSENSLFALASLSVRQIKLYSKISTALEY